MKIISLNTCGGALGEALIDFVLQEAESTDVFCLQEMYRNDMGVAEEAGTRLNLFSELSEALPQFAGKFEPVRQGEVPGMFTNSEVFAGSAMFVKRTHEVTFGSTYVVGGYNQLMPEGDEHNMPVALQFAEIGSGDLRLMIGHVHALPYPGHKLDTPERLEQSDEIVRWVQAQPHPVALLGDCNLLPHTESIARIVAAPMRNLIDEFRIPKTRPEFHMAKFGEHRQSFADYAFVSPQLEVKTFSVPDIVVSDHLPLVLELK